MKLPNSFNNKITKWGIYLSVISFFVILGLLIFAGKIDEWSVAGILSFVGLVVVWIIGLIMIPLGMSKTEKRNSPDKKFLRMRSNRTLIGRHRRYISC